MIQEAEKFTGTALYEVLTAVEQLYSEIDTDQKDWKAKAPGGCPDGCGKCCVHFEPEIYEAEALYLAAWMLENQKDRAEHIAELGEAAFIHSSSKGHGDSCDERYEDGCVLFDPCTPYHCTVYGGRCLICRLFGFSGDHGKDGYIRWKPCRHMQPSNSAGDTAAEISGIRAIQTGHQYEQEEMLHLFGAVPPFMGAASSKLLALNPDDTQPQPLRTALPAAIRKLKMLLHFLTPPEPDCPSPHPLSA